MKTFGIEQGTILTTGTILITVGGTMLTASNWFGVILITIGAGLVYWRESRKN